MINIVNFDFNKVHLLKYKHENSKAEVPLIAIEKITKALYMHLDYLMFKHYGREGERYLKLVLMFNNRNDISTVNIGESLMIPSLTHLLSSLELIEEDEISMIGINAFSDNNLVENVDKKPSFQSKDKRKTTANPRLNITLERPKLDGNTLKY